MPRADLAARPGRTPSRRVGTAHRLRRADPGAPGRKTEKNSTPGLDSGHVSVHSFISRRCPCWRASHANRRRRTPGRVRGRGPGRLPPVPLRPGPLLRRRHRGRPAQMHPGPPPQVAAGLRGRGGRPGRPAGGVRGVARGRRGRALRRPRRRRGPGGRDRPRDPGVGGGGGGAGRAGVHAGRAARPGGVGRGGGHRSGGAAGADRRRAEAAPEWSARSASGLRHPLAERADHSDTTGPRPPKPERPGRVTARRTSRGRS